jgi:hypothetical protein
VPRSHDTIHKTKVISEEADTLEPQENPGLVRLSGTPATIPPR